MKKIINAILNPLLVVAFISTISQAEEVNQEERLKSYTKLTKAIMAVEKYYVEPMEFEKLIDKTISGLLTNLDAHSTFMNKEEYKNFNESTNGGDFGGIGISVGLKDKLITIIAPIEDTPGERAGLKSEDRIVKINGESCIDYTLEEAVSKMRGKAGTNIKLTILRKGEDSTMDFDITREKIVVKSVKSKYVKEGEVAYLRVTNFDKNVFKLTKEELKKYPEAKGIILDLRNNPGGLLNQAVDLVDLFIEEGEILSQKGRSEEDQEKYFATKEKTYNSKIPLAVIVNGGSASASEIVSGALQDRKRAILIGTKTFGKGSVQAVLPFNEDEAIKVTIAKYYLPSGRSIQAKGVEPDIICEAGKVLKSKKNGLEVGEKDYKNHLKLEQYVKENAKKEELNDDIDYISIEEIEEDNQLNTALNTIKTISILKAR